ncbi:MAG: hypothetical protein HY290_27085 [Planctomycetia bacterium]|nr:hypothetical protein [Planctomycetia bacterium]
MMDINSPHIPILWNVVGVRRNGTACLLISGVSRQTADQLMPNLPSDRLFKEIIVEPCLASPISPIAERS